MLAPFLSRPAIAPMLACMSLAWAGAASAASLIENFDDITTLGPAGWTLLNRSVPIGVVGWFQGSPPVFPAFSGAPESYIGASFNNANGAGTVSNWLWTPALTFSNGDVISFYTRTATPGAAVFPDRLELRFSTGFVTAPSGDTGVGSFTNLLLSVNPSLAPNGYPTEWTQFTATISGLSGPTTGNVAFRYFVTNSGPDGSNGDFIGIDNFSITPVPEPGTYGLMALGMAAVLLVARRRKQAA